MHLASACAAFLGVIALLTSGCDVSARFQYRIGSKVYERSNHHYYGQIVAYDGLHDFHNGMNAQPAVEIELASSGGSQMQKERVWASCDVVGSAYVTE